MNRTSFDVTHDLARLHPLKIAALLAMSLALVVPAALPQPAAAEPPQEIQELKPLTAAGVEQLAKQGEFIQLLQQLENSQLKAGPHTRELIEALQSYRANQAKRDTWQQQAYKRAMTRMQEKMDADKLEDALVSAIDAESNAVDHDAFFLDKQVVNLVERSTEAAEKAKEQGDWVQAMSYYRLLDMLFTESKSYRDELEDAARHLRVLQLYAPKHLMELVEKQRQRRGNALDDDTPMTDPEPWENRLKGVDLVMLEQSVPMILAAHVDSPDGAQVLAGGVKSLIALLNTPQLVEVFPALKNKKQVDRFRSLLSNLLDSLNKPGVNVDERQARAIVRRIISMNQLTVYLPQQVVVFELAQGMVESLDDFTAVIWPEDQEFFSRTLEGKFTGVGIQISRRDGELLVISPLPNTPAQRAGIKAGDVIAKVDGHDTSTWGIDRAVREITGPEGEIVTLSIARDAEPDLINIPIKRAQIKIQSIRGWDLGAGDKWDYLLDEDSKIGYIRLDQFIGESAADLDKAIATLGDPDKLGGLILDLRYNPGGRLDAAVDVSDRFVDEGPIVSTVDGRNRETDRFVAHRAATYKDLPLVILINNGSASASEIVSGAMQDYDRAFIVGERTFGKGSVQNIFPLDNGKAFLKLTTQHYVLPSGRIIHRKDGSKTWGIDPNLEVPMSNRQLARLMEFRNEMDVFDRSQRPQTPEEVAERLAETMEKIEEPEPDREAFEKLLLTGKTVDILEQGLDPQLEAAQLIIKAKLAAKELAGKQIAEKPKAEEARMK